MRQRLLSLVVAFLLIVSHSAMAQDGWVDDFSAASLGSGWWQTGEYGLSQADGQLKVTANKSTMWASFGVNLPADKNVTANPVVNVKIKTATPFLLSVWLIGPDDKNVIITQPVLPSTDFNTISFDFTGMDATVLAGVKRILLGFNGSALSWQGTVFFDELSLGSNAVKLSNVAALADMTYYQGTQNHKILVRGVNKASVLELSGHTALIENVVIDPIAADGTSWIKFNCKAGVDNTAQVTLTARAISGYTDNSITFNLSVEGNKAPVIDNIGDVLAAVNVDKSVDLKGISDGNSSIEQSLVVSASSDNTNVVENSSISIDYATGSRYATLHFKPKAAGTAIITVTVNDGQATNNLVSKTFSVDVKNGWNNLPTLNDLSNVESLNNAGEQTVELTGISDGDGNTQSLVFTAVSSNPTVVPNPVITYTSGSVALLKYTPVNGQEGKTTITVTLADNGGTAQNNGNQSIVKTFEIETYSPPLQGYVIPFTGASPNAFGEVQEGVRDYWHVEGLGTTQVVTHTQDAGADVFKIVCNGKSTWSGSWYYTPDMDLTDFPLLSMWVRCDQQIKFHLYFWDDVTRNNEDHHIQYTIPANVWTKVDFDFSDAIGMINKNGEPVNAKRIKRVLFNYHPSFGWPFTNWNGTVEFKDVRIGDQSGITPTYYCAVNPVGAQTYFMDTNQKTIKLTGLSRGKDKDAIVSVTGNGTLKNLAVSQPVNGEATITFNPSVAGNDVIKVTVSGAAIAGKVPVSKLMDINVFVVDKATATPSTATVNLSQTYQTFRGLGAMSPGANLADLYTTGGFGATGVRIGLLDNQVETENDNADPYVLDRSGLNYNAIDWNYVRKLKAQGVENFVVTLWSPPAWMKENLSINYQQAAALTWDATINKVIPAMYEEYAENAVALVTMFKEEAGVDLLGIGLQNEPAFCEPYASAILSPVRFAEMIAIVGKRFEDLGITTKLYVAEQVGVKMGDGPIYSNQAYLDAVNNNAEAKKYSDVFAVHGYASDGVQPGETPGSTDWTNTFNAINANGKTRELWMTETEPAFANWEDAFVNAVNIRSSFEYGNVCWWTEWAWDGHCIEKGKPTQKFWAQSMFQYIKPGAKRLSSVTGHNDILTTAWKNDATHGDNLVMVIFNKGNTPLTLTLDQADIPANYTVYRCSEQVARFKDANYTKGDKLLLAPRSIVTLISGVVVSPTINEISNQLVLIDAPQKTINLSGITDGNASNQNAISIEYSLSDNTIIKDVAVNYTSPNSTGTFVFSPLKGGTTRVTLTVTANGIATQTQFDIQVKDYTLPTINPISGTYNYEKGTGVKTVDLSGISDGGDGGQTLSVTAQVVSSTPANVISGLSVQYSSPAAIGSVTFEPSTVGTCEIEVTVTDNGPSGKNTVKQLFTVTVYDHYAPTVDQVAPVTAYVGERAEVLLTGVTNGGDTDEITMIQAVSSAPEVTGSLSVSTTTRRIRFTPLVKGQASITVTITDNGSAGKNSTTMTFEVEVDDKTAVEVIKGSAVQLYPNPVTNLLKVELTDAAFAKYEIITSTGALVKQGLIENLSFEIEVSDLEKGVYFLKLQSKTNQVVKQFVK